MTAVAGPRGVAMTSKEGVHLWTCPAVKWTALIVLDVLVVAAIVTGSLGRGDSLRRGTSGAGNRSTRIASENSVVSQDD